MSSILSWSIEGQALLSVLKIYMSSPADELAKPEEYISNDNLKCGVDMKNALALLPSSRQWGLQLLLKHSNYLLPALKDTDFTFFTQLLNAAKSALATYFLYNS